MKRRCFLKLAGVGALAVALPGAFARKAIAAAPNRMPNIVYILADDLGYGDLGCYNPQSKIPTPNLDRLATQGLRFTDAHAPTAVCTPTRYSILTGRYCWRSPLKTSVLWCWDKPLITQDRLTVAKLLKKNGYDTACIGKWHLGWDWPTTDGKPPIGIGKTNNPDSGANVDFTKPIANGPTARGFDYYFGTAVPNFPPYCFIENDRTEGIPTERKPREMFGAPGPMLKGWKLEEILPGLERKAVEYIDAKAGKLRNDTFHQTQGKPFFLYFPLTAPHTPVAPAPEFVGKSQAGPYGDFVHQVDHVVGKVMKALERNGLEKDTLVIFTSDNGPEVGAAAKPGAYAGIPQYGHYSMDGLRGVKRDAWEGGHRVPFIARWPGKTKPGATSDEIICHVDFMATCAALVGEKLPDNAGEDSYSILPALLGEKLNGPIRKATVLHSISGKFALRQGDWVLIDAPSGDDNREPDWFKQERGYTAHTQPGELYNLREDLTERRNLYGERPEIVQRLKALLEKYKSEGRSTPGAPQKNE